MNTFFAFNKYSWMMAPGDTVCSIPKTSGYDRILQACFSAFIILTPLVIILLRKLYTRNWFGVWLNFFAVLACLCAGWWVFWGRNIFCI
ncbi:DUF2645 family protein [Kluyvera ascorbata]|nr:DUF2645 family protein [Kluyvera ascorbata]UPQ73919.1 DUF2645 family protein [Kluyvera ascorbata]